MKRYFCPMHPFLSLTVKIGSALKTVKFENGFMEVTDKKVQEQIESHPSYKGMFWEVPMGKPKKKKVRKGPLDLEDVEKVLKNAEEAAVKEFINA